LSCAAGGKEGSINVTSLYYWSWQIYLLLKLSLALVLQYLAPILVRDPEMLDLAKSF